MAERPSSQNGLELSVTDVCKEFSTPRGPLVVLDGVSFSLAPGGSVVVVGPSGSGKSTLLNILGSLDKPTSGNVRLGDIDVAQLEGKHLSRFRNKRVGFVFQDHHLLPQCTALENVLLPTLAGGAGADHDRAEHLLDRVGLGDRMHDFPARLSGGERQRVAVARALVNSPPLLLCDEPTGNLDRRTGRQVGDLFTELVTEQDVILVLVTHDLELARRFERRYRLSQGRLRTEDESDEA